MSTVRAHSDTRLYRRGKDVRLRSAYLISYDLDKPGQDDTKLINRLTQLGAFRVLKSQWALSATWTAVQIRG